MKQNKRGISDVVTTVLIIMLTLVAVGVIAGFIVPFAREGLQKSTECTDYQGFYTFDESLESDSFKTNCKSDGEYIFSIKSNDHSIENESVSSQELRENIKGIKLIIRRADETTSSTNIINGSISESVEMYNGDTLLVLPRAGGIQSYKYFSEEEFVSAEIYPILKNERICADVVESIKIKACQ